MKNRRLTTRNNLLRRLPYIVSSSLFITIWGLGIVAGGCEQAQQSMKAKTDAEATLAVCESQSYVTLPELHDFCRIPGSCGERMACEGKVALIVGVIDYGNVFDHAHYPQLPYEKFLIHDKQQQLSLEVWAMADDNGPIFEKIRQQADAPEKSVFIKGILVGVDMPVMGQCSRDMKLEIHDSESIFFEDELQK